ncbi:MAG: S-layer homology domain-containing protein [Clostridia bacterium]|nr:S-layer homology domain-containing protein [Clostridia bacterium]
MKRKIKNILSFILAAVITVSISGFGEYNKAYAKSVSVTEKQYNAMEFLRLLSIIPDYYDYNTILTDTVTRADFVAAAARAVKATEYTGNPYFYDVSELHWAYKEISAMAERGVVSGREGKLFRPDESITKPEAYKIICILIGSGNIAELDGGYPAGYIKAARDAEIDKYVSGSQEVTVGDMFMIIYNAINTKLMVMTGSSNSNVTLKADGEKTILSVYYDIYYNRGILNGLKGTCLDGSHLPEEYIHIGDFSYLTDITVDEYFGEEIEYFYKHDEHTDENTVIWAKPTDKDNKTRLIDVNYNASFDEDTFIFTYELNGADKKAKIDRGATVLYNGAVTGKNLSELLADGRYTVKLLSDDGNDVYNTVIIRRCENYYVTGINSAQQIIYQSGNGLKACELNLDPNNYSNLVISLYGAEKTFDDIKKDCILSVFKSLDGQIAEVNIVTDKITGKINNIEQDGHGRMITIDGKEYYMPAEAGGTDVSFRQDLIFYLDVNGEIAYVKPAAAASDAAYIIRAYTNSDEDVLEFKLLTGDGAITQKKSAGKMTIDGVKYNDIDSMMNALKVNGVIQHRFVLITFNKDDLVTSIDTPKSGRGGENDVLEINIPYVAAGVPFVKSRNSFRNYCVVDDKTVFFMVPEDENIANAPESFFRIGNKDILTDQKTKYKIETYKTAKRIGCEQFVVIKGASEKRENKDEHAPILVKKFYTGLNADDESVNILVGYTGASEVEYAIDNKAWETSFAGGRIKEGDIIKYEMNVNDEITDVALVCGLDNLNPNITTFQVTYGESKGYVDDLTDGVLTITKECGVNLKSDASGADRVVVPGTTPCIIFDTSQTGNDRIRYGSIEEAKTYTDVKKNCSMIYEYHAKGTPKMFVVYLYQNISG